MLNPYFLLKLSEGEKKALIVVAVIFAFLFVLIGLVIKLIKDWYNAKGEEVDNYMYDYVKYGIVKNPAEFRRYVMKREKTNLYLAFKVPMRILIVTFAIFIILNLTYTTFAESWNTLKDLAFHFDWPTVKLFGISVISDWPTITKYPEINLSLAGYVTYITAAVTVVCSILLIKATLIYNARIARSTFVSSRAYKKNLENGVDVIHE